MPQISVNMSDEGLDALRTISRLKGLRPATYASYLLTNSVKGHAAMGNIEKEWERLEKTTQYVYAMKAANWKESEINPDSLDTRPAAIEERFGWEPGEDVVSRKELTDLGATSIDIIAKGERTRITSHEGEADQ